MLAAGDGATDLAMRDVVDLFVAYTGFVTEPTSSEQADVVAASFAELERVVRFPPLTFHPEERMPSPPQRHSPYIRSTASLSARSSRFVRRSFAAQARARVIRFESGDPSFAVAPHVLSAITDAGAAGKTLCAERRNSELRRALAEKAQDEERHC